MPDLVGLPLSICIPTYNRAPLLQRTLERLSRQTAAFSELTISDNASSDDTRAVVEAFAPRFARVRYVRQTENLGPFRNIYASMALASSELVFVLSDDDALIEEGIASAVDILANDPACVAVYGGYERWDAALNTREAAMLPVAPGRFTAADKLAIAQNSNILTFPVARRAVIQRHCFFDDTSFGLWSLIAQLLGHGAVRVLPIAFYQHASTVERQEQRVVEPWYHDFLRADWEVFAGSMADANLAMTVSLIVNLTGAVYGHGELTARSMGLALAERTYLLRQLSYQPDTQTRRRGTDWERVRLIAATTALLALRIRVMTGAARLVVERGGMNLGDIAATLARDAPGLTTLVLEHDAFLDFVPERGDVMLAEYWDSLEARAARHPVDPSRELAVGDLLESARLPGSLRETILYGPSGSAHFVRRHDG